MNEAEFAQLKPGDVICFSLKSVQRPEIYAIVIYEPSPHTECTVVYDGDDCYSPGETIYVSVYYADCWEIVQGAAHNDTN